MATVTLTWKAPATGEAPDKYRVYRKVGVQTDVPFGTGDVDTGTGASLISCFVVTPVAGTDQSYPDTTATDGATINYCLRAEKDGAESTWALCKATSTVDAVGQVFTIDTA